MDATPPGTLTDLPGHDISAQIWHGLIGPCGLVCAGTVEADAANDNLIARFMYDQVQGQVTGDLGSMRSTYALPPHSTKLPSELKCPRHVKVMPLDLSVTISTTPWLSRAGARHVLLDGHLHGWLCSPTPCATLLPTRASHSSSTAARFMEM
jgi:hypothetical protein